MGIDLGALLRGAAGGISGYEEGKRQRAEAERQARMDMIRESLFKAQTQQALHPAKSYTSHFDPNTGLLITVNEATGDRKIEQLPAKPTKGATAHLYVDPVSGNASWVYPPEDEHSSVPIAGTGQQPPGTATAPTPHKPGAGRVVPIGQLRQPSIAEREARGAAKASTRLIDEALGIIKDDPEAMHFPMGAALARGASGIANKLGAEGVLEPLAQQQLTKNQAAFQQKMDQLLHFAGSVLPKGGRSVAILQNLRSSYSPTSGAVNYQTFVEALHDLRQYMQDIGAGNGPLVPDGGAAGLEYGGAGARVTTPPVGGSDLDAAERALGIKK